MNEKTVNPKVFETAVAEELETAEINYKESLSLHERSISYIKPKECYNSVFNVLTHVEGIYSLVMSGSLEIVYGYMNIPNTNIAVRHCFFMDLDNKVIDVTIPFCHYSTHNPTYYPVCKFDLQDYLDIFNGSGVDSKYPALHEQLKIPFTEVTDKLNKKGILCLG